MSDVWRPSDGDSHVAAQSPWHDADKTDPTPLVLRTGYGDNVSPLVLTMKPVDNNPGGADPNVNGGNGRKPWRAGLNVATPAANMPPVDATMGRDPNQNNAASPWRVGMNGANAVAPRARSYGGVDASSPDQLSGAPQPAARPAWDAPSAPTAPAQGAVDQGNPNPSPWLKSSPDSIPTQQWRAQLPETSYHGPVDGPQTAAPPTGAPDWRTYINQQQQAARPADAPGSPANPGLNKVTDEQRQFIENSLHLKTSMLGYLGTGAITGGAIGGLEWGLDKKLIATIGQPHTGVLGWWENHSPLLKQQETMTSRLTEITTLHESKTSELALAEEALTEHARGLHSMITNSTARVASLAGEGADEAERQFAAQQHGFITNAALRSNPISLKAAIGTAEEVEAGAKLFVKNSTEAQTLENLALASRTKSAADLAVKNASQELDRTQALLTESVENGAGTLQGRVFNGAAKGLAISAVSLAAGYYADKAGAALLGYKSPNTDGMGRFALDGIAVPAVLLSDMSPRWKFALAGSAFLSARIADWSAGTGASVQTSMLLRPNTADGILITAAAMAPVDAKTKALLIGGAWLAGRAYNEIAHLTGLDGGAPEELKNASEGSFNHDQLVRTEATFDKAVENGKALGKENEAALELQMRDWLSKQGTTNPITHMRGTAILSDALGQFRLEEGSRLDRTSHADKKERILKGFNYDFGGEATTWLRMAAGSLISAQNFAIGQKGKTVDGQLMDDNYIQQLKNEQTKVEAQLKVVYGEHDIKGVFDELVKQTRVHSDDMQQALVQMKNQLDVLNSGDTRFVAKASRDMTIGYLAEASYMASKGDGESSRTMYQAAVQYLHNAEQLDAQCPDNQKLEMLQSDVAKNIPGAIADQYKSNLNNPFQLPAPNYGANLLGK